MGLDKGVGGPIEFEVWYAAEYPKVVAALTIVARSREVAVEATSEAFVRAWERWDRVSRMASPGGWLYRVALNLVRRRARRAGLERHVLRLQAPLYERSDRLPPDVWDAVSTLSRRQRTAVALRYICDYSEAEVAEAMGVRPGTASATLAAARRKLQGLLADPGWTRDG